MFIKYLWSFIPDPRKYLLMPHLFLFQDSTYPKKKLVESYVAPRPLRNVGLNCYLNSTFQSIVACSRFVNEMKKLELKYPTAKNLIVFNNILSSLSDNLQDSLLLSSNEIFRHWNKPGQQDSYELLSHIMFQVFNEIKYIQQKMIADMVIPMCNWTDEVLPLRMLMIFTMKCSLCGFSISKSQTDLALHLPIPFCKITDELSIPNLMETYFTEENVVDSLCMACEAKGKLSKLVSLKMPPSSTVCIHLQRSFWNSNLGRMQKNHEKVTFSEKLTIERKYYLLNRNEKKSSEVVIIDPREDDLQFEERNRGEDVDLESNIVSNNRKLSLSEDNTTIVDVGNILERGQLDNSESFNRLFTETNEDVGRQDENGDRKNDIFPNSDEYLLKSVIVHHGNSSSGHYICYRLCGGKWFCANDSYIHEVNIAEVLTSEAYVLMYERD